MINTNILLFDGSVVDIKEVNIGDKIMGYDSKPRKVVSITKKIEKVYKFTLINSGESHYFSEKHILSLIYNTKPSLRTENGKHPRHRIKYAEQIKKISDGVMLNQIKIKNPSFKFSNIEIAKAELQKINKTYVDPTHEISITDYLNQSKSLNHRLTSHKSTGIEYSFLYDYDIDPYLLGLWLGDGDSKGTTITSDDKEIVDYLYLQAKIMNQEIIRGKTTQFHKGYMKYKISKLDGYENYFLDFLRKNNIYGNKHIPESYKYSQKEDRLKIIAGLIDTDGHYSNKSFYEIYQKNKILAQDIVFIVRSLGYWCHIKQVEKGCWYKGDYRLGIYQKITFGGLGLEKIPVLLERKKATKYLSPKQKNYLYYKFKIEEFKEQEVIKIDFKESNKLFLLGDFTIAHC